MMASKLKKKLRYSQAESREVD